MTKAHPIAVIPSDVQQSGAGLGSGMWWFGLGAALLEVANDCGGGGSVEALTAGVPPTEHGLGKPQFGGPIGALGVVPAPGRGPGQGAGQW
jgi:hypothetical protein